jgi:hypothetical protein
MERGRMQPGYLPYRRHTWVGFSPAAMSRGSVAAFLALRRCSVGYGGLMPPKWVGLDMRRVIAVVACGFSLAACSEITRSLSFLSPSPPSEALRFESKPPGAQVKTSLGSSCLTPCELTVQAGSELSATFALAGHQPRTIPIRPEGTDAPRLAPNPVYAELHPVPVTPAKKPKKKKPAIATSPTTPVTAGATASVAPAAAALPMPSSSPEAAVSAANPWPSR